MTLTRSRLIGPCSCKRGGCRICGSACKRCKCACDGESPFDALARMKRGRPLKMLTTKRIGSKRPKRMKLHNKSVVKPTRRSKRGVHTKSWKNVIQDDDSSFSPSMCTFIDSETKMKRTDSSKSGIPWISAFPDLQMFENEEFFHEGLKELSKIMHKISLPSTTRRLHKLLDESITYSSLKYIANPAELIGNILEALNLPPSPGKSL